MVAIIAAMAELEHSVIRERVIAGQDYARTHGTKIGSRVGIVVNLPVTLRECFPQTLQLAVARSNALGVSSPEKFSERSVGPTNQARSSTYHSFCKTCISLRQPHSTSSRKTASLWPSNRRRNR